jgi:hypothetical protein
VQPSFVPAGVATGAVFDVVVQDEVQLPLREFKAEAFAVMGKENELLAAA